MSTGSAANGERVEASTAVHRWVERCRAGTHEGLVARLESGWVILAERQVFLGYCLLLPDPVVGQLNALAGAPRAQFLADMALVGDALMACTDAVRINYAMFGNLEPALHAHIFPRRADEPHGTRTAQPWALDWNLSPPYDDTIHGELKRRIGAYLNRRAAP
jgi:diadenosine tetraphosphate (Ap4A) HIT family hydrolase